MGKVYLTGAGPGDIELMTMKAYRLVQAADVLVYDRLANPEILNFCKDGCEFINVGKEDGHHIAPQEEINEILYQLSLKYETVVRLKGGDPFVFGRGGEEGLYLYERGVKFEIIPGISSSIAAPAYAGIPVTHRNVATSFKVITGHESANKATSQINWECMKDEETLVFLMGFHKLKSICTKLQKIGKSSTTPIAVISKGTTTDQKVVVGTLENIVELSAHLSSPVMFIIGEVVNFRTQLNWFETK
ncbi:MAG: uroporphyrinogen-III C-methyltransferase [Epsilonproteobacteria bacterium]|nr:uroporphyrinogen-III C-methyltransferase [Campylobacterota bacterium]